MKDPYKQHEIDQFEIYIELTCDNERAREKVSNNKKPLLDTRTGIQVGQVEKRLEKTTTTKRYHTNSAQYT